MNKRTIILFIAEIAAVAALRMLYMIRRDKMLMPRSSKVNKINRTPVFRQPHVNRRGSNFETKLRETEIEGWTPKFVGGKIQNTPDDPPDA